VAGLVEVLPSAAQLLAAAQLMLERSTAHLTASSVEVRKDLVEEGLREVALGLGAGPLAMGHIDCRQLHQPRMEEADKVRAPWQLEGLSERKW